MIVMSKIFSGAMTFRNGLSVVRSSLDLRIRFRSVESFRPHTTPMYTRTHQ